MVESLTRDRRAVGSSLTGVTVLCPLAVLSTGSTQKDPSQPDVTERLLTGM